MGRQDPARQQAIRVELATMEPSINEELYDFNRAFDTEDSHAIEASNDALTESEEIEMMNDVDEGWYYDDPPDICDIFGYLDYNDLDHFN